MTNTTDVMKARLGEEAIKQAQKNDEAIAQMLNMFPLPIHAMDNGMMSASPGNFNKLEEGTRRVVDRAGLSGESTVKDRPIYTMGFEIEPKYSSYEQRVKTTPVNKGKWSSERAESLFISDKTGEIS